MPSVQSNPPREKQMTEAQLMRGLIDAARALGYLCMHMHFARNSETGWPDVFVVGHGRAFAFECKTQRGRVRQAAVTKRGRYLPGQDDWINALADAGIDARIVRPSDYDDALAALSNGLAS